MKHSRLFLLGVLAAIVVWASTRAQTHSADQHTHWQLMIASVDLSVLKIVKEIPANHIDYTKEACFALKDVLDVASEDGRYQLVFACVPVEKVDT